MIPLLAIVVGIGSFILWIMVLIRQFRDAGVVHGIIGIITCGIWTFIWGWINANRLNIKNLMLIWTALVIAGIIINVAFGGAAAMYPTQPIPTAR
ncbi:MAG TPA: hypothetical protein VK422_22575 [Pyrinomonadaceae bacterium]|nr:hypothetical protein [Pyrinomonadaceae bacterium]